MMMKNLRLGLLLLPLLLIHSASGDAANGGLCNDVMTKQIKASPAAIDISKIPRGYIQIGYESEYLFEESALILRDYAPDPKEISTQKWKAMTDAQHIEWLKQKFGDKPEFATDAGLHSIKKLPFKPEQVIVDSTGNLEIVMSPFDSYEDWEATVDIIAKRFGVGSQQAMVSEPRELVFGNGQTKPELGVEKHLGWLIYTNLRDMFAKMESGYIRYLKTPDKLTALSFDHAFVGPMIKIKRDMLERYIMENANGGLYDEPAKQAVRKSDASFKYTSGPSYRPDIAGPGRFSWEIRNAHKDLNDLKMKVRRDIVANLSDMTPYLPFTKVPAFDSIAVFDQLPKSTQAGLAQIFPTKANPAFEYNENELRSLETYRNFALPLMDFRQLVYALAPNAVSRVSMQKLVAQAQIAYRTTVISTVQNYAMQKITVVQAKAQLMGAVGRFAHDSGLSAAFDAKAQSLGHEQVVQPLAANF
jgi:hypothetical protein